MAHHITRHELYSARKKLASSEQQKAMLSGPLTCWSSQLTVLTVNPVRYHNHITSQQIQYKVSL